MDKIHIYYQILELYADCKKNNPDFFDKNKEAQSIEKLLYELNNDLSYRLTIFTLLTHFIEIDINSNHKKQIISLLIQLYKGGESLDSKDGFGVTPIKPTPVLIEHNPWPEAESERAYNKHTFKQN